MSSSNPIESSSLYVPPKVWKSEGDMSNIKSTPSSMNRPTAGSRFERELPKGKHPFQLHSQSTPNGQKVTIMFEELLAAGYKDAEYDAHLINIMEQDQFSSGFVEINPNSKIPALLDYSNSSSSAAPVRVFESGNILLHLAEKFDNAFLPADKCTEVLNWLFWQVGSAPYLGGGYGHFYHYNKNKMQYPIDRFTMETKRQLDVLNQQLAEQQYIAGDEYTIADIAIFPWYGGLVLGRLYGESVTFLNVLEEYPHVVAWAQRIAERPAVIRGRMVNNVWGDRLKLANRHDASDIDKVLASSVEATGPSKAKKARL